VIKSAWTEVFGKKAKVYHQKDDGNKGGKELIDHKILKNIRDATIVVGVLSMGSKEKVIYEAIQKKDRSKIFSKTFPFNANVALEIGYAMHSVDSQIETLQDYFFIADKSGKENAYDSATKYFFDVGHRDIIPYEEKKLGVLRKNLKKCFTSFKKNKNL
jgi:hypothetical protein